MYHEIKEWNIHCIILKIERSSDFEGKKTCFQKKSYDTLPKTQLLWFLFNILIKYIFMVYRTFGFYFITNLKKKELVHGQSKIITILLFCLHFEEKGDNNSHHHCQCRKHHTRGTWNLKFEMLELFREKLVELSHYKRFIDFR